MDPSEGCHEDLNQDNDKLEKELPSFSRFFPYCEINEVTEKKSAELFATGPTLIEDHTKLRHSMSYETDFRSKIFDTRTDIMESEDRARQLAAVRKRSRQWKDQSRNGKEINLDMKDKSLERIVAAIAEVCELNVNVGGRAIRNISPEEVDKQVGVAPVGLFTETVELGAEVTKPDNNVQTGEKDKAEKGKIRHNDKQTGVAQVAPFDETVDETAVVTKPDNNVRTGKTNVAGKGKMRKNDTSKVSSKDTKTKMTIEELSDILSDIDVDNKDVDNEREKNKEAQSRLRNMRSQSYLHVDTSASNVHANDKHASGSEELSTKGHKEAKVVHVGCRFSPYHKLPPISDMQRKGECPKPQRKLVDTSKTTGPPKKAPVSKCTSPIVTDNGERESPTAKTSANRYSKPSSLPHSIFDTKINPMLNTPLISSSSSSPPSREKHREWSRMRYRWRVRATPITENCSRKLSNRSYVMTEAGCKSQTMSYELMGLKRPENVPIYVRRYRTHCRSRNVKLLPVSPTTGTPYLAILPNYKENESPRSTPSPL